MYKYHFLLIKQQLEAIADLPKVMWFNAQYDETSEEAVYYVPAVYIEFLPFVFDHALEGIQYGDLGFRVHLMTENYNEDDQTLAHLDLANQVHQKLHHFEPMLSTLSSLSSLAGTAEDAQVMNRCIRTQVVPDHGQSNIIVTIQEYHTTAVDLTAYADQVLTNADLNVIRP